MLAPARNSALSTAFVSRAAGGLRLFLSGAYDYTAAVASSVASTTVTPTVSHSGASYTISLGGVLQSSDAATAVTLAVGDNVITVAVTAEDGSQQNYVITIHRASS